MQDELKVYRDVCEPRFATLEKKVDATYVAVNNGLGDRVKNMRWLLWALITMMAGLFTTQIALFNMMAKHITP